MKNSKDMIFGIRAIIEAIESGKTIDKILLKKDIQSDLSRELFNYIQKDSIPVQRVPLETINRITRKNHQGAIAFLSPVPYQQIETILPTIYEEGRLPFVVVLDGITDVRNFGAIARTCECAGVDAIIIPQKRSVSITADAIKTSAGALMTLPICKVASLKKTIEFLKDSGLNIVAASEKATQSYTAVDYSQPTAIIMGSEDVGISPENLKLCNDMVSIPILGKVQSLNVSVAAGVLIYECVK
jgi:23S rRNA (guanosine2251-2'-O)-methyltransferase